MADTRKNETGIDLDAIRPLIPGLDRAFQAVTDGVGDPEKGIYPVFIDGKCVGLRLGKEQEDAPGDKNSLCFIAGTHQNELCGWRAFSEILTRWTDWHIDGDEEHPPLCTQELPGSIYLLPGGNQQRIEQLFALLMDKSRHRISQEEYAAFRLYEGENHNRVAVLEEEKVSNAEELIAAKKEIYQRHHDLEERVYSRCGLVMDLHSMSQPAKSLLLPHIQYPALSIADLKERTRFRRDQLRKGTQRYMGIAEGAGAEVVFSHLAVRQHGVPFAGRETEGGGLRCVFEAGGPNTEPEIWKISAQAALGSIGAMWEQLSYLKTSEKVTPKIYGEGTYLYLPSSPYFKSFTPKSAVLVNEISDEDMKNTEWNLITGKEPLPEDVREKFLENHLPGEYTPGRLANGAKLNGGAYGSPVAYTWHKGKLCVLGVPPGVHGDAIMFPANDKKLLGFTESVGVVGLPMQLEEPKHLSEVRWGQANTKSGVAPDR